MTSAGRHLLHPRDEIMLTMERIYRYRMTTTSGGNLSLRDENGDIWITPSRVDKGSLRRDDIVCVRHDGTVDGIHQPSSEYPFHKAIYQVRPDIRGIVHAHSVALVAASIVGQVPDTRLFHQSREVCGAVGFAPYALPGSERLGAHIARTFQEGFHCVILENHGVVVGGKTLQNAFQRFETLEFTGKTIIKASMLGQLRYLNEQQLDLARRVTEPLPTYEPSAASSQEKELRRQLCAFLRRGYHNRLLISTEGSFSARLDAESFLITPRQLDRHAVELDDIVLVQRGRCEAGKVASRAAHVHQAIYDRHPQLGGIVNAYTVNATAFSVTGATLDARTIPESFLLLRDVQRMPFGPQFAAPAEVARCVSLEHPILLQENDGVLVCGTNVLDAFDRLEVLEATAEALINSVSLGPVRPMPAAVIEELIAAFLKKT
jgi:L-fuculose-phosphate aldolase